MSQLKKRIDVQRKPGTFFVHGPPGIGKTELVAQFPDPLFIIDPQEDGVMDLVDFGWIEVNDIWSAEDYQQFMEHLKSAVEYPCKTVVIETLAGWEALMHNHAFTTLQYKTWDKFTLFNDGARACARFVRDVIDLMQAIRQSGKIVIMTGHTKEKSYRNPVGPDFDKLIPEANKETWSPLAKWFQNIFYYALDFSVDESQNIAERPKASSCGDRVLYTSKHPAYEAKNRLRLPETIAMGSSGKEGFANLSAAIKEARS